MSWREGRRSTSTEASGGTDVAIALAPGARGVFVGRPYLYALAAEGEAGVVSALQILEAELHVAMTLLGAHPLGR